MLLQGWKVVPVGFHTLVVAESTAKWKPAFEGELAQFVRTNQLARIPEVL